MQSEVSTFLKVERRTSNESFALQEMKEPCNLLCRIRE